LREGDVVDDATEVAGALRLNEVVAALNFDGLVVRADAENGVHRGGQANAQNVPRRDEILEPLHRHANGVGADLYAVEDILSALARGRGVGGVGPLADRRHGGTRDEGAA